MLGKIKNFFDAQKDGSTQETIPVEENFLKADNFVDFLERKQEDEEDPSKVEIDVYVGKLQADQEEAEKEK